MGIKGLMKLISDHAPSAVKEKEMENYFGLKVAVDASMSLYQFLIAVRSGPEGQMLTNEAGDVTSHLQGMLYRTARMLENGVKPVFVFDGKPPQLKKHELDKRTERREENEQKLADFKDSEDQENINRYEKRLVKVTKEHNAECRRLLSLMGVPIVEAPGEAEAQCAALCKAGKVYATATEDMDALTFGTSKLVRHMTFSKERKLPIVEVDLATVLRDMELSMEQFIDLCILCGCDYTSSIRGIGPTTAYKLIKDHKSLEKALTKLGDKHKVPEDFMYKEAHQLFVTPDVMNPDDCKLVWSDPDEEGIIAFLVGEKGFALERVKGAIKRLKEARGKGTQKRMESFFGVTVAPSSSQPKKRKEPEKKGVKGAAKMAGVAKFADSKKGKAKGSTKKEPAKKKAKTESDD